MIGTAVGAARLDVSTGVTWSRWLALTLALAAGTWVADSLGLSRIWMLLALSPALEEVVFRYGAQEALLRHGVAPVKTVLLTAALFGLAHVLLRADLSAFAVAAPALVLGLVYARWRRLWPCVMLHSAMNGAWVAWRLALPTGSAFP